MNMNKEELTRLLAGNPITEVSDGANQLHKELLKDFSKTEIPYPDFDNPVFDIDFSEDEPLFKTLGSSTVDDITERKFGGKGVFDALLESVNNHIKKYYDDNLITKDAIPKIVASSIEAAMSNSIQYVLNKDLAKLEALKAKYGVYNSIMQLEATKAAIRYQMYQGFNEEARFTNIKMDTLNKKMEFDTNQYSYTVLLPISRDKGLAEVDHIKMQSSHLKAVIAKVDAEITLTNEQYEAMRGQTMDTRTDGTIILGSIGKQKDLHSAQIRAYKNDSEYKLAQMYSNAYLAQAASDPGIKPPNQYTQTEIDKVISTVKVNLGV